MAVWTLSELLVRFPHWREDQGGRGLPRTERPTSHARRWRWFRAGSPDQTWHSRQERKTAQILSRRPSPRGLCVRERQALRGRLLQPLHRLPQFLIEIAGIQLESHQVHRSAKPLLAIRVQEQGSKPSLPQRQFPVTLGRTTAEGAAA